MEEKKCEDKKEADLVPRWRSFLNLSPSLQNKSKANKPPSPASATKLPSPHQDASIFSMSKNEFLQIADDQFEDLKVVRISSFETEEEGTALQARRLDFSDVEGDATGMPGERAAAVSTIKGGELCEANQGV
jgi:hypothetical protein